MVQERMQHSNVYSSSDSNSVFIIIAVILIAFKWPDLFITHSLFTAEAVHHTYLCERGMGGEGIVFQF